MEVINLNCPGCGNPVTTQTKECEYCGKPILVQSFKALSAMPLPQVNKHMASYRKAAAEHPNDKDINTSTGLCFLRLKQYDQAISYLEKAEADNFEDATPFFYVAVARLKGRKPFVLVRSEIEQICTDLESAMSLDPKPEQYYFMAYVKHDYYERKCYNTSPKWTDYLQEAVNMGLSNVDIEEFHAMVGTPVAITL